MLMLCVLGCIFASLVSAGNFDGNAYEAESRATKFRSLWSALTQDQTPLNWYSPVEQAQLFLERMNPSFDFVGDDMPMGPLSERKKLIHTQGVVAKAVLTFSENNYTGFFKSGADSAILRLSLAAAPKPPGGDPAMVPGLAIKLLRDGAPSANIFAMYSLLGQQSYNFFENDFSNHPPYPNRAWAPVGITALVDKFKDGSLWPTMIGLSSLASQDQTGLPAPGGPNFPYRIIFHPTKMLHTAFPSNYTGVPWSQQLLKTLSAGMKVYDIYVQDKPLETYVMKIGELSLTTDPCFSAFGDRHYFHEHTRFEQDLTYKPEWHVPAGKDIQTQWSFPTSPGYQYPKIPW